MSDTVGSDVLVRPFGGLPSRLARFTLTPPQMVLNAEKVPTAEVVVRWCPLTVRYRRPPKKNLEPARFLL